MIGPDVSDWQDGIDWQAVKAFGCSFGVTKATEGTRNVQATLDTNRAGMAAAGMVAIGLYHFARPENGDPSAQADHFLNIVGPLRPREFVVLDVETGGQGDWPWFISVWCQQVARRLGVTPVVYMSESPAGLMPDSAARWPLWVAGYVNRWPTAWSDSRIQDVGPWRRDQLVMWQYTSSARIDGIAGNCDMNVAPSDLPARLGLVANPTQQEDTLTPDEHATLYAMKDSAQATNEAVARIETAVLHLHTGLTQRAARIEQKLAIETLT
jgi:lysozyme